MPPKNKSAKKKQDHEEEWEDPSLFDNIVGDEEKQKENSMSTKQMLKSLLSQFQSVKKEFKDEISAVNDRTKSIGNSNVDLNTPNEGQSLPNNNNGNSNVNSPYSNSSLNNNKFSNNQNANYLDKDLYPILNNKLELDFASTPKLDNKFGADECANWHDKMKTIVDGNQRLRLLMVHPAEQAWNLVNAVESNNSLVFDETNTFKLERASSYSLQYLYNFICRCIPEDMTRGIKSHMLEKKDKYSAVHRLNFISKVATEFGPHNPFVEDVYALMQLLELRFNSKDCNRLNQLHNMLKRLTLLPGEHPQTIFTKFDEINDRIRIVHPHWPRYHESTKCYLILGKLPRVYSYAVDEIYKKRVEELKEEDVIHRLASEFAKIN